MVYLARTSNAYCKSVLRLVMLMIYNTFSALYKESWQSMKREWRQGNILPRVRTELRELKKWIKFKNEDTWYQNWDKIINAFFTTWCFTLTYWCWQIWKSTSVSISEQYFHSLYSSSVYIRNPDRPLKSYWPTFFYGTSMLDKMV